MRSRFGMLALALATLSLLLPGLVQAEDGTTVTINASFRFGPATT